MNDKQGSNQKLQNLEEELNRIEGIAKNEGDSAQSTQTEVPQPTVTAPVDPATVTSDPNEAPNQTPGPEISDVTQNSVPSSVPEPANPMKPEFTQELQPEEKIPLAPQPLAGNKKSSKFIMITVAILFILSLSGLGFYLIGAKKNEVEEVPVPSPTLVTMPTPTVDPTVGWKLFSGKLFSLKYPNDITPKEENDVVVFSKLGPTQTEGTEMFDGYIMGFYPQEVKDTTLESYVNALIDEVKKQDVGKVTSGPDKIKINNYDGLTYTEEGLGTFKQIVLVTKAGGLFMQISILVADPGKLGFQETADLILSTFKFIEVTAAPSASPTASASASPSVGPTATP